MMQTTLGPMTTTEHNRTEQSLHTHLHTEHSAPGLHHLVILRMVQNLVYLVQLHYASITPGYAYAAENNRERRYDHGPTFVNTALAPPRHPVSQHH